MKRNNTFLNKEISFFLHARDIDNPNTKLNQCLFIPILVLKQSYLLVNLLILSLLTKTYKIYIPIKITQKKYPYLLICKENKPSNKNRIKKMRNSKKYNEIVFLPNNSPKNNFTSSNSLILSSSVQASQLNLTYFIRGNNLNALHLNKIKRPPENPTKKDKKAQTLQYYSNNKEKKSLFSKIKILKKNSPIRSFYLQGGMDFGFRNASVCLLCAKKNNYLYILRELYKKEKTPQEWLKEVKSFLIPYLSYINEPIWADSHEPGQIKSLQQEGLPIMRTYKIPGSWERGVKWLASHTLVIDPSCINAQKELSSITIKSLKPNLQLSTPLGDDILAALRYTFHKNIF